MEKRGVITEQTPDSPIPKACGCEGGCKRSKEAQAAPVDRHIATQLQEKAANAFRK